MTESEGYERIGRLVHKCEHLESAFTSMLDTLAKVVSGEIDRSRVMVNLTEKSVMWSPEGERPSLPATINGVPVCVVAPEDATADVQRQIIEKLTAELDECKRSLTAASQPTPGECSEVPAG